MDSIQALTFRKIELVGQAVVESEAIGRCHGGWSDEDRVVLTAVRMKVDL
jgi:hypothetical protein